MAQMRLSDIPERPLQALYLDHVKIEECAFDARTGDAGYPWLTLAIDAGTRMVAGFHLSLAPPSRLSVGLCLLHAVCDKTRWMKERGVSGDWPAAGLPEAVAADPQSVFGLRAFARACRDEGVATVGLPVKQRVFGALATHMVGGRLGEVSIAKAQVAVYAPETPRHLRGAVARDMRDLERAVGDGLVNDYHRRRHQDTGRAPIESWRSGDDAENFRAPKDCLRFRLSFLPETSCAVTESGVSLRGETYWSRTLAQMLQDGESRATVRFDPRDHSRIFVRSAGGRFVKAKNVAVAATAALEACDEIAIDASPEGMRSCRGKCRSSCPFAPAP